ncbi:hypothetical protein VIOR3934_06064 [Vibrio orientalis CIP 102891 = ATCC 33934]|uniref:Uncharacterized protein n=1 Tax=Vibrio orientalis CIP 102891 = ATCC 33934 TaxID=675816 RepID=C9QD22_VIBOR|nr:DUF1488 domain-containing protein [Vibrio orientalis]EEX95150.1 hypothetical protein VIA_000613 [Vibrio orientalis CIP 102891 = ATCC 33934]EGU46340.1 hypothetical protein VIOR3934_06064 [Vibrio orientalis CIP 102891 = ATCC 33934]
MNQSILFPDIQSWDEEKQAVLFSAQQSGALIQCLVDKQELEKLSGQVIGNAQQALEVFSQYRFDLEELAEELIEEEEFNSQGNIEVVS